MTPPKVTLIEDDETMRPLICALLEMEGFSVSSLHSLEPEDEVLQDLSAEQPDLVLLDVNIHGKDSFGFVQRLKSQAGLRGVKILMSSGMALEEECQKSGADGFLLKPYMPDELIEKVEKLIGRK
jgi:DNA-binding response OmpR family regulator